MRGSNKRREERREKPVTMFLNTSVLACSRLRDSGEKSFSKKKWEKRAGAGERLIFALLVYTSPLNYLSRAHLIFAFLVYTSPLYYLRAWHRLPQSQPRTQASSRYPSYQKRLGTERDRLAWQVTPHPKSPRTTGDENAWVRLRPRPLPENRFSCQKTRKEKKKKEMLKCGNVRCNRVSHARQVCLTLHAKPSDWRKCWRKLSKLTNHGVYQELVTGMRHWQQWCLHAPPSPSLPSPHAVFAQNFLKPLSWSLEQATFAFVNQL